MLLTLRHMEEAVEGLKAVSLEIYFPVFLLSYVSYVLFDLSCTRVYILNGFVLNILVFT